MKGCTTISLVTAAKGLATVNFGRQLLDLNTPSHPSSSRRKQRDQQSVLL
jgi:hypothetical protein